MSEAAKPKPKKSIMPPSRIAVIVFAIIGVIVIFFQWQARSGQGNTYDAIYKRIEKADKDAKPLYKKDLDQYLQGNPTREESGGGELFTWSGPLMAHRMRLTYGKYDNEDKYRVTNIEPE